jgi:hypothetical protein
VATSDIVELQAASLVGVVVLLVHVAVVVLVHSFGFSHASRHDKGLLLVSYVFIM